MLSKPPQAPAILPIVLMGVCGSGKTTVGEGLAARLGVAFRDADEFHPHANVAKMSAGIPLTDEDRWPWLDAIGAALGDAAASGRNVVISCSALKRIYRDRLRTAAKGPVLFVFLDGAYETLKRRLVTRKGHFMPPSLLDSQLQILERPTPDELAIAVDIEPPVEDVVAAVLAALPAANERAAAMQASRG
jgi:gluconokinase